MPRPALLDEVAGKPAAARPAAHPLRDLWAIDQRAPIVDATQTSAGKAALVMVSAGLAAFNDIPVYLVLIAAVYAYWPKYRTWSMLGGGLAALYQDPRMGLASTRVILRQEGLEAQAAFQLGMAALVAYIILVWCVLALVRREKTWLIPRRPVASLLGITALLCALTSSPLVGGMPRAGLWTFLSIFSAYFWFFAYAILDQRSRERSPPLYQMGLMHPFWGSTSTPFGKGGAFLRKHQAKTADALAVTQLKAIKLFVWAAVLLQLNYLLVELIEGRLGIPTTAHIFDAFMRGSPYPVSINWASLAWASLQSGLLLAVWGHNIIAVARLAGFRLPRNTWRPLEARTLAEFWNRYYYYFKELLVDFFFFPTFLRFFRNHPHLRVFFATFMAAGVGNALYHFIANIKYVATMGLQQAIQTYTSNLFYCFVLAIGIGVSQARTNAGRRPSSTLPGTLVSLFCVWSFFVGLRVFGDETRTFPFHDRLSFFASLFGI